MRRRDILVGGLLAGVSRYALAARGGSGRAATQAFASLTLDNFSWTPDGVSAITVGNVVAVLSPTSPASTASITLGGADAASFQLTNSGNLPCAVQAKSTTVAGAYSITLTATQAGISGSPFPSGPLTLTGAAAGTGPSITFVNTSGSASPSPTPMQTGQAFVRGAVPSGSIATPTVAGSPLGTWQADNQVYWDDGSLQFAVFRFLLASVAGSGSVQVVFVPGAGSWPTTSTVTTANVTAETDHKVVITNCHTAQAGAAGTNGIGAGKVLSLTMSGGAITGGTVWFPSNMTAGTTNVSGGGGTGAQVSVTGGVITIVAPGTGYGLVGGTGSFSALFNTGIGIINGSGNHVGASLVRYAKGPACDAWRLRMPISGMNHAHVTFYIERWKTSGGTLLAYKRSAVPGNGLADTTKTLTNYTYDLDWKDGSTVIRGTTNGSAGFTNLLHFAGSSFGTFDASALEDWSANDAAYKAVVSQRIAAECDEFKASGLPLPWLGITPTVTVPTTPAAYETGLNGGRAFLCVYQPLGSAGVRSPLGSAGSGNQEDPLSEINALHWMSLRAGLAGATTWLRNSRVGAANSLGSSQLGGGVFDPTTFYAPNVVPASAQAFSGMTPTLESSYIGAIPLGGYANTVIDQKGSLTEAAGNPYHQVCLTYYPYLIEGAQWMLDALMASGTTPLYAFSYAFHRQATLGSTLYYGIYCNTIGNVRVQSWWLRSMGYAAAMMPSTWSDGTTNIEKTYVAYSLKRTHQYLTDLAPFTGSVKFGSGGAAVTKSTDFSNSGWWPENYSTSLTNGTELTVPFMDDYVMMNTAHLAFLHQGTATGTAIAAWRDYFKLYYVALWAYAGSHYLNDTYRLNGLVGRPPAALSDITWSSEGDTTTPKLGIRVEGIGSGSTTLAFTSGVSTVALTFAMRFLGTTRCASGTRIKLTATNIDTYINTGKAAPGGFDFTTWYYWKELTATTGQLCSDAGLTLPITPSTSVSGLYFWVVPSNTLPADNSGNGSYNGGKVLGGDSRIGAKLGTMRLCQAMGMDDSGANVTNAIASCAAIFNSIPGQTGYAGSPQYGWDSAL